MRRCSSLWRIGPATSALSTRQTHLFATMSSSCRDGQQLRNASYSCFARARRWAAVMVGNVPLPWVPFGTYLPLVPYPAYGSIMRIVVQQTIGGPEVLEVVSREEPTPGPGEVLIQVGGAGVN